MIMGEFWKNRENTSGEIHFWRVLVIWNLCVAVLGSAVEDGRLKREFGGGGGGKGWRLKALVADCAVF